LVSALLVPGSLPAKILRHFRAEEWQLVVSGAILEEYGRVLRRKKFGLSLDQVESILSLISARAIKVIPSRHFSIIEKDPADNEFLDVAVEAGADAIVSGDAHLLSLKSFHGISILTPAEFLK
jgi:putative PIN family toxin of toxin-antitoxin system